MDVPVIQQCNPPLTTIRKAPREKQYAIPPHYHVSLPVSWHVKLHHSTKEVTGNYVNDLANLSGSALTHPLFRTSLPREDHPSLNCTKS